jgi:hypothetical protein
MQQWLTPLRLEMKYYGYLPQVFALLQVAHRRNNGSTLGHYRTKPMGSDTDVEALLPVGELLVGWREHHASTHNQFIQAEAASRLGLIQVLGPS